MACRAHGRARNSHGHLPAADCGAGLPGRGDRQGHDRGRRQRRLAADAVRRAGRRTPPHPHLAWRRGHCCAGHGCVLDRRPFPDSQRLRACRRVWGRLPQRAHAAGHPGLPGQLSRRPARPPVFADDGDPRGRRGRLRRAGGPPAHDQYRAVPLAAGALCGGVCALRPCCSGVSRRSRSRRSRAAIPCAGCAICATIASFA